MKHRIETLTILLILGIMLLAGCDITTKQQLIEYIENVVDKQQPKNNLVSDQEVSFDGLPI
jgi:outer membrane protein assembly factor BamE (lipoprotein component of BamABCDE complex)